MVKLFTLTIRGGAVDANQLSTRGVLCYSVIDVIGHIILIRASRSKIGLGCERAIVLSCAVVYAASEKG